jgi:hypothetical protein
MPAVSKKPAVTAAAALLKGAPKPFDYEKYKLAFQNPDLFTAYLEGYPNSTGLMAYFYRLIPKIDLGLIGVKENYIHKTTNPAEMTEDFCARTWGRGTYMLKLSDANRPAGKQEAARTWFRCDDPDLVPIYDPRTLCVNDPQNADEVARLVNTGVLVREAGGSPRVRDTAGPVVAPLSVAPPPAAPVAQPMFATNVGEQVLLKLLERALPSATPQTASEVLAQSFQIAERLNPRETSNGPNLDQIADAVVARLRPAGTPAPAGSIASELDTWERVNSLLDRIGAGRGDAAKEPTGWAALAVPMLSNMLAPLVPLLAGFLATKQSQAGTAGVAPLPIAAARSLREFLPPDAPIMDRVMEVAELALEKSTEGVAGFRFASWLCGFHPGGMEVFQFLEQSGGAEGCMGMIAMSPALNARVAGDPARAAVLEAWLEDFFSYDAGGEVDNGVAA